MDVVDAVITVLSKMTFEMLKMYQIWIQDAIRILCLLDEKVPY